MTDLKERKKFLKDKKVYLNTNYPNLNPQEVKALMKLNAESLNGIIKIGRPPGSPIKSVEFTILTI